MGLSSDPVHQLEVMAKPYEPALTFNAVESLVVITLPIPHPVSREIKSNAGQDKNIHFRQFKQSAAPSGLHDAECPSFQRRYLRHLPEDESMMNNGRQSDSFAAREGLMYYHFRIHFFVDRGIYNYSAGAKILRRLQKQPLDRKARVTELILG